MVGRPWGQFQGEVSVDRCATTRCIVVRVKCLPIMMEERHARDASRARTLRGRGCRAEGVCRHSSAGTPMHVAPCLPERGGGARPSRRISPGPRQHGALAATLPSPIPPPLPCTSTMGPRQPRPALGWPWQGSGRQPAVRQIALEQAHQLQRIGHAKHDALAAPGDACMERLSSTIPGGGAAHPCRCRCRFHAASQQLQDTASLNPSLLQPPATPGALPFHQLPRAAYLYGTAERARCPSGVSVRSNPFARNTSRCSLRQGEAGRSAGHLHTAMHACMLQLPCSGASSPVDSPLSSAPNPTKCHAEKLRLTRTWRPVPRAVQGPGAGGAAGAGS